MNKAGIEVFEGFGIEYPEYEVVTPQTKQSYTIRTLTTGEEDILKGSSISPSKLSRHVTDVLWKCIVKKPDSIKSFDDFIKNVTLKDRDALLYGLYVASYKEIQKYNIVCEDPDCKHKNTVNINLEKGLNGKFWDPQEKFEFEGKEIERDNIIKFRMSLSMPTFGHVTCVIKAPTIKDELDITESDSFSDSEDINNRMAISMIDKFVIGALKNKPEEETFVERSNIETIYKKLPSKDKKYIISSFNEIFKDYQVYVESIVKCQKCGKEQKVYLNIADEFFRALYQ